jgi:hypothetical protein
MKGAPEGGPPASAGSSNMRGEDTVFTKRNQRLAPEIDAETAKDSSPG